MMFSKEFLSSSILLNWSDIRWGYQRKIIGWRIPVELAADRLTHDPSPEPEEIELAGLTKNEDWRVGQILEILSHASPTNDNVSQSKWLYLTLLSLYENRDQIPDLWRRVEEVYADFGYPEEMRPFVPFIPPEDEYDPGAHSIGQNEARLQRKWKEYLTATTERILSQDRQ